MNLTNKPSLPGTIKIILLNGVSSSGKTSIAKELQKILEPTYLHLELDMFIDMFPDDYDDMEDEKTRKERRNNILSVMNICLDSIASAGYNLIVDHVLDEPELVPIINEHLANFDIKFIGVHCDLDELQKREAARGNRKIGIAKGQYKNVHLNKVYDFSVDTTSTSPNDCARQIIAYINRV